MKRIRINTKIPLTEYASDKTEKPIQHRQGVVYDVDGNKVVGEIVYQKKADYGNLFEELSGKTELNTDWYKDKKNREKDDYKLGRVVKGRKGIIHDVDGNEVVGEIVYQRKAIYQGDPFESVNKKRDH